MTWSFQWYDRVTSLGNITDATTVVNMNKVMFRSFLNGSTPPVTPINQLVPLQPGSFLKYMDTEENEVELIWLLEFRTEQRMWEFIRRYPPLFSPVKDPVRVPNPNQSGSNQNSFINLSGEGKLRVTNPNGVRRDLICRCTSGFNIIESDLNVNNLKVRLTFYANHPYWRGVEAVEGEITYAQAVRPTYVRGPKFFIQLPIRPVKGQKVDMAAELSYKTQFDGGDSPIHNPGDVSTDVTWTITGPCDSIFIQNLDTGQVLQLQTNNPADPFLLGASETITIRTRNKTAIKSGNSNTNQLKYLTTNSNFWQMRPGNNQVRVVLSGAGPTSKVQWLFRPYYLGVI